MISIVIPTYNERDTIKELTQRLTNACKDYEIEIIIVDDNSPDGTGKIADNLAKKYPIKVIHRDEKLGLSSAVINGISKSSGDIICVMDADLSHPPEIVPELIEEGKNSDIVIASRYVEGGSIKDWSFTRRIISYCATMLARPLVRVKDPISGFFLFRRTVINGAKLDPIGFKICLEILAKGDYKTVKEIPFIFSNRSKGSSKLNLKEILGYIKHINRLYIRKFLSR